ncbi:MAG: outer membrane protein transport protein, partial [Pseudomonadota bacterium]
RFISHNILLALFFTFIIVCSIPAYAANGIQLIGIGAVHRGLGGAGVAKPLDSTAIYLNPAGMNNVGRRFDLNFTMAFPKTAMNTTPAGGNAVKSEDEGSLLPSATLVYTFMDDKIAAGIGAIFSSGFGVDYPASRLPSVLTGNTYDTSDRYGLLKIIPAFSYRILDNLYAGVGVHINYAFLQTNSAVATFTQTTGTGRFDPAIGIGASFGLIYEPLDWLSLGTTYTSRQYFERFRRYKDLLAESLDMPQQVAAGVAVTPIKGGTIMADFRWINWSGIGQLGDSPAAGGFGWRDQYVLGAGLQYNFKDHFDVPVAIRTGYNYGRSPIAPASVYANALVPAVIEHHLSGGISVQLTKNIGLDGSYTRGFKNTVTDNGAISGVPGSTLSTQAHFFTLQLNVSCK